MGSLNIPDGSPVYVDAQIIIYSVETHPTYWPLLRPFWASVQAGNTSVFSSELSLMECIVHPLRAGDLARVNAFEGLFVRKEFNAVPVSADILRSADNLRAMHGRLRTPDAIHVASATATSAQIFLTNDRGLSGISINLNVINLDDALAAP